MGPRVGLVDTMVINHGSLFQTHLLSHDFTFCFACLQNSFLGFQAVLQSKNKCLKDTFVDAVRATLNEHFRYLSMEEVTLLTICYPEAVYKGVDSTMIFDHENSSIESWWHTHLGHHRQTIIWTGADLLSIGTMGTNCCNIWIRMQNSSSKEYHLHTGCHFVMVCYVYIDGLTHWGRGKMDAVFQTAFSIAFSWMKMHEFLLRFHWNFFLRAQLTIFQHWFR